MVPGILIGWSADPWATASNSFSLPSYTLARLLLLFPSLCAHRPPRRPRRTPSSPLVAPCDHPPRRTMSDRPTTSAGGRRPPTASASAAHSSSLPRTPPGAFDHGRHYSYDNAFIEEEEEESDAEDLFAFLPPSTADQQRELEKQRAQEHFRHPSDYSNIFANAFPPPSGPPAYPAPVFHSHSRFPSDAAGPSSLFQPPISSMPVESPPSTASQQGANDHYRMQRLGTARTGTAETRPSITSIREIHVNLPPSIQEKDINMRYPDSLQRKRHPSSTIADTATLSLTPSMLEQDSRDGSIKCVYHPPLTPPPSCLTYAPC